MSGTNAQHIGWLKQFISGMDETNWKDMRLRAERQLDELAVGLNAAPAQGAAAQITDAMVKAGAAAICCQAGKLGCAAKSQNSEFTTCVISTFMQDARRCLEAALAISTPAADVLIAKLDACLVPDNIIDEVRAALAPRTPAVDDSAVFTKRLNEASAEIARLTALAKTQGEEVRITREADEAKDDRIAQLEALVEDAVASFRAIQKATVEGRVCDDVAWFSQIETLHDYCGAAADRLSPPSTERTDARD